MQLILHRLIQPHLENLAEHHVLEFVVLHKPVHDAISRLPILFQRNHEIFIQRKAAPGTVLGDGGVVLFASLAAFDLYLILLASFFVNKALKLQKGVIHVPAAQMDVCRGHLRALNPAKMLLHLCFRELAGQSGCPRMAEQMGVDMLLYPCLNPNILQHLID